MLRQFAPFRYLPKTITDEIEAPVNLFTFDNGETIYQPGETSTDVYVIKHGSILIERQNQEENHRLNVYGTGIYFGERAVSKKKKGDDLLLHFRADICLPGF